MFIATFYLGLEWGAFSHEIYRVDFYVDTIPLFRQLLWE